MELYDNKNNLYIREYSYYEKKIKEIKRSITHSLNKYYELDQIRKTRLSELTQTQAIENKNGSILNNLNQGSNIHDVFKLNLNQSDKLFDIINPNNIENNVSWGKLSNISEA